LIRDPTENDVCKELFKIKNYNQIYLKQQVKNFRIEPERQLLPQFEDIKSMLRALNLGIQEGPGKEEAIDLQLYSIYMQSNYMQFLRKIAKSCHPKIFQLYAGFENSRHPKNCR
jgi:hypothetical protein